MPPAVGRHVVREIVAIDERDRLARLGEQRRGREAGIDHLDAGARGPPSRRRGIHRRPLPPVMPANAPMMPSATIVTTLRVRVMEQPSSVGFHTPRTPGREEVPVQPSSITGSRMDSAIAIAPMLGQRGLEPEGESGVLPDQHVAGDEQPARLVAGHEEQLVLAAGPERLASRRRSPRRSRFVSGVEQLRGHLPLALELHQHGSGVGLGDGREAGRGCPCRHDARRRRRRDRGPSRPRRPTTRSGGPSAVRQRGREPGDRAGFPERDLAPEVVLGRDVRRQRGRPARAAPAPSRRRTRSPGERRARRLRARGAPRR